MANRKERIAKGIELLDKEAPGWCEKVDLKLLDLGSPYFCVLGQVYKPKRRPEYFDGGYSVGTRRLKIQQTSADFGFDKRVLDSFHASGEEYLNLTAAWKQAIRAHCPPKGSVT